MTFYSSTKTTNIIQIISKFLERYGVGGSALILGVELVWAASVLVPVLLVIGALFNFTSAWMAVLPGFLGAVSFLIVLLIGGLAATLPSAYLAKWRERIWVLMERRYPAPAERQVRAAPIFPHGLDIQDAD